MADEQRNTSPVQRFRVAGYGGVVQDDDGRYVRFDDVEDLARELMATQDKQAGKWLLEHLGVTR